MPRVKRGLASHKRHKRLRKFTKGYVAGRRRHIRRAHEARLHALEYKVRGRREKKRIYRSVWIVRINNALKKFGDVTYGAFIHQMQLKNVHLDRKTLAYLATNMPTVFKAVVQFVTGKQTSHGTRKTR